MATLISKKVDPKKLVDPKKAQIVPKGDMAQGSAKFNAVVGAGNDRAIAASKLSTPSKNVNVSYRSGGSNMGDKSVGVAGLLGRGNVQYKAKATISKKK